MMKVGKAEQDAGTTGQINHARKLSSTDSLQKSIKMQLSFISFCSSSFLPPATGTACVSDSPVFGTRLLFSSVLYSVPNQISPGMAEIPHGIASV